MKKKTVLVLSFIFSLSAISFAQTKTVTNDDLEKFRRKRLQSEREYRENYQRLGFPSPEELERKRIEDEENLIEFSQQLETQRLEREAVQAEAQNQALWLQNQYLQSQFGNSNYDSGYYYPGGYAPFYDGFGGGRTNRRSGFFNRNRTTANEPYPWLISPQFRRQRILSSQPSRFLPRINDPRTKPRIRQRQKLKDS